MIMSGLAMLFVRKLTPASGSGADYYLDLAAKDISEYYTGSGEAPGLWFGSALAELPDSPTAGSRIDSKDTELFRYLNSREMPNKMFPPARRKSNSPNWVSGYDLTFAAPKSISMLATMHPDPAVRRSVTDAFMASVQATLAQIEQEICYGREGKDGVELVEGNGLVGALFQHRTARPADDGEIPDPHLHVHAVIANMVQHPDGSWGSLDGRAITAAGNRVGLAGGAMQAAQLRYELERRGVHLAWQTTGKNGAMEIDGVPASLLQGFSSRHDQIKGELERVGLSSSKAGETAQKATRRAKDKEVAALPDTDLATLLQGKLASVELFDDGKTRTGTIEDVTSMIGGRTKSEPFDVKDLIAGLASFTDRELPEDHLTANKTTFTRWDVVAAVARHLPVDTPGTEAERIADELLDSEGVVQVSNRTADSAGILTWTTLYTTQEILDLEAGVLVQAERGLHGEYGLGNVGDLGSCSSEQVAMVTQLLTSGNAVDAVVGVAGSGKTFALKYARGNWEQSGHKVIGCSTSAAAAIELETGSGVKSSTIAKLLGELDSSVQATGDGLAIGTVLVVDEAGMAQTRDLARLASYTRACKGKLVLVGDYKQLTSVGAGGLFGWFCEQRKDDCVVELKENIRNEREARLLEQLRDGTAGVGKVIEDWQERGLLHTHDTHADAMIDAVGGWNADRLAGYNTVLLASTRQEVMYLNALARQLRIDNHEIGEEHKVGENVFSVGDRVMAGRNNYRHKIHNGQMGMVAQIHDTEKMVIELDNGKVVTLPASYTKKHVSLGYARTIHKAQGITVERTHIVATDQLHREAAYVAASRAKQDSEHTDLGTTHVYVAIPNKEQGTEHGHELVKDITELEQFEQAITTSAAQTTAIERLNETSHTEGSDGINYEI
jgi:conjugative relaxase-like TrwC/TraI family protein